MTSFVIRSLDAGTARVVADEAVTSSHDRESSHPMAVSVAPSNRHIVMACMLNHNIKLVDLETKVVCDLVGDGIEGYRDGGAREARFASPNGIAVTPDGCAYIVGDTCNHNIRIVDTSSHCVSTLAGGSGLAGFANGSKNMARFSFPRGLAVSPDGLFVLVADSGNHCIRRVCIARGDTSTLAGGFRHPQAVAISPGGDLCAVADTHNDRVCLVSMLTGGVQTLLGGLEPHSHPCLALGHLVGQQKAAAGSEEHVKHVQRPSGVAFSRDGQYCIVGDSGNHRIRLIHLESEGRSTLMGNVTGRHPRLPELSHSSRVEAEGYGGSRVLPMEDANEVAFEHPRGVAVTMAGDLVVVDTNGAKRGSPLIVFSIRSLFGKTQATSDDDTKQQRQLTSLH